MTDLTFSENDLQELYHHGILGQKWGHKNGPPYPLDASDHSASEKKAGWRQSLQGAVDSVKAKKAEKANIKKEKAELKEAAKKEKAAQAEEELKKAAMESGDAEKIKAVADKLTNAELQQAVNRMNLMAQVNQKIPTPEPAQNSINSAIGKLDDIALTAAKGIDTYNKIARLYNKFNEDEWPVFDSTLTERLEKESRKNDEALEKARKDLANAAIKSADPNKVLKARNQMTTKELQEALQRMNAEESIRKKAFTDTPKQTVKESPKDLYERNIEKYNADLASRAMSNREKNNAFNYFNGLKDTEEVRRKRMSDALQEWADEIDSKKNQ